MGITLDKLKKKALPKHIAIILDGNGRWAHHHGLPRSFGHRQGAINLKNMAFWCNEMGIEVLTVYAFSTENWNRPKEEVDYLFKTPVDYFNKNREKFENLPFKIKFIGRRDRFSKEFLKTVLDVESMTKDNPGMTLLVAADYGSRYELTEVTKKIASMVEKNKVAVEDITPELINESLYTGNYPDVDLLIRTSGEIRISNFLLWQISYSELYFTKTFWPAFNKKELYKAVDDFQHRNRRFGKIKEEKK